jgi:hypothetical protein
MLKKPGPYILLFTLTLVLIFIVGVRYGQNVEKTNKTISNYLLSITPTKPIPTVLPLAFQTYQSKTCGISFLYPNSLTKEKETSQSAQFNEGKETVVSFDCEKNNYLTPAAASSGGQMTTIMKTNPKNGKRIIFTVKKNLLPLIESSLQFNQ